MDIPSRHAHAGHPHHDHDAAAKAADTLKNAVCGMTVTAQSAHHVEHDGQPYYFCSSKCKAKFSAEPQKYVADVRGAASTAPPAATVGAIYTCPMHPKIRQDHPGNCPKCGMTLEPVLPSLAEEGSPELIGITHRFWRTLSSPRRGRGPAGRHPSSPEGEMP